MRNKLLFTMLAGLVLAAMAAPVAAQNLPQALYYKFNEGTGTSTANSAIPGYGPANAAFTGSPTWVSTTQPLGAAALRFGNGSSGLGQIETGNWPSTALPSTQSFTIEFWMRNTATGAQYLLGDSGALTWRLYLLPTQGISMRGGGFGTLNSSTTAPLWGGTWEHVAFVYNAAANTGTWFINGVQDTSFTSQTSNFSAVTNFRVGGYTTTNYYYGDMDEFRFWTEARTVGDIQTWMNLEAGVTGDAVVMSNQSPGGNFVTGPQTDLTIMDLKPQAFNSAQTISALTFTKGGNVPLASIGNVKLVNDLNDNGIYDAGDTVLGDGPLTAGGTITFNSGAGFPIAIPLTGAPRLLLTVSSVGSWNAGDNISFSIATSTDITWSGGTDYTTFPVASPLRDITPPLLELGTGASTSGNSTPFNSTQTRYMTIYSAAEMATIPVGSQIDELQIHAVSVPATVPSWATMVVRLGPSNTDPNAMDGVFDNNYSGSPTTVLNAVTYSPTQLPGTLNNGRYAFTFTTPYIYTGGGLVVEYQLGARTGTGFTVTSVAGRQRLYSTVAGIPPSATPTTSGDYGLTLFYTPPAGPVTAIGNAASVGSIVTGAQTDLVVMDLRPVTVNTPQTISSLTISKTGTLGSGDIGQIKLVHDINQDGQVDAGDVVLGQGTLTADAITFNSGPGFPIAVLISGPPHLLVAVSSTGPWAANTDVEFSIATSSDITWSGGTDFSSFPISSGLIAITPPVITIGLPGTGNSFPFNFTSAGRYQTAYTAAELSQLPPGSLITELHVYGTAVAPPTYGGFELRLAHSTTDPTIMSLTWNNYIGTLQTVIGPTAYTPTALSGGTLAPSKYVFTFTTPFVYNGIDGLLIDWSFTSKTGTGWTVTTGAGRNRVYHTSDPLAATPTSNTTSGNWGFDMYFLLPGPMLTLDAQSGVRALEPANVTGPGGNGYHAASFDITSNDQLGASLTAIELTASGTGNDSTAYSEIAIYEDTNSNGTFEFGTDTLIGTFPNFATDNGSRVFNVPAARQDFPINSTREYLIVIKLNGTANSTDTFDFTVTDFSVGPGTNTKLGIPSVLLEGVQVEAPTLSASATTGTAAMVFNDEQGTGNNGLEVGEFTIGSDNVAGGTVTSIEIAAFGTGNDATAYSEVAVYQENGATANGFQFGQDILIASHTAFPTDDGTLTFNVPAPQQNFGANVTRTYYIVVKLAGTAAIDETFNFEFTDFATADSFKAGLPTAPMLGLVIRRPEFLITDTSSTTQGTVFLGDSDVVMQSFEIEYQEGASQAIDIINIRATGNGHDANHLVNVRLVRDANGNGVFDVGDYIIGTQQYAVDNGSINFDHTAEAPFTPPETREYLVMYDFNNAAPHGANFGCYVQNVVSQIAGTLMTGVPAPTVLGTAGVQMIANILEVNLDGPSAVSTVNSNAQGPTGHGLLLANVTVAAPATAGWTINGLTFEASGTGNADTAFSEVALYRDTGNGTWDGAAVDTLAAAVAAGFSGNQVTFNPSSPNLSAGQTHRYFLVGKLNGSATSGQTFDARLEAINASSSTAGLINGVPTVDSTGLIIDVAAITIGSGPGKPANILRKAGTAAELPMAQFRLTATNDNVGVNSINLTTAGTGDWDTSMAAGTGVQLWLDDGDGSFSSGSDTLLASANGASPNVLLSPATAFTVPSGGSVNVWVVVSILDTAGAGASAAADTFSFSVLSSTDLNVANGNVVVSNTLPPTSAELRIIDFSVASFDPLTDIETGGAPITITGTGFIAPVTVRIGGVLAGGSPSISGGGTQITGLTVPAGVGTGLAIQITSGGLPAETLADTFEYTAPPAPPKPKDDSSSDDDGGGCATGTGPWLPASLLLLVAASAAVYRRRRA